MTPFETYLINNGWSKNVRTKDEYRPATDKDYLSTMGNIDFRYCKDGREIVFGLGEPGYPPTLLSPLPQVVEYKPVIGDEYWAMLRKPTTNEISNLIVKDFDNVLLIIMNDIPIKI